MNFTQEDNSKKVKHLRSNANEWKIGSALWMHNRWLHAMNGAQRAAFVGVFAIVGVIVLVAVHAANIQGVSISPQAGKLSGNAAIVSDSSAIGGSAVKFGVSSSSGSSGSSGSTGSSGSSGSSCGAGSKSSASPSGSSYGSNALKQWNCAIAGRASTAANWVVWGDSIAEGQGSSSVSGRWANQTLNALRSKYPVSGATGGFGYIPAYYATYGPDSQWSTDPKLSGAASANMAKDDGTDGQQLGNGAGLGLLTVTLQSGGSDTFKVTGTSIDILYNHGSGTFSYKVDSGGATNVSASGSGATGSKHVAFSAGGSHTVVISGVSGSVVLEGIMTYNGDENKGIHLYDGAQSGATSGDFKAQATNLAAITANVKADLVVIELGANDYGRDGGTPSQLSSNLKTMVSDIRSASTSHEPSIVIMLVYSNDWGANSLGYSWSSYRSAIQSVTTGDSSLGLIDMNSFATAGTSSPYLSATDQLHPSDAGQTRFAGMVEPYLEDE